MENQRKLNLFADLLRTKQRLTWTAQLKSESLLEYNNKITTLLDHYNNLGKIAQIEFIEVIASTWQREQLAIYVYLKGLRPDIKRYICKKEIYQSLRQAQDHARLIENHLNDLKRMKKCVVLGPVRQPPRESQ